MIDAQTVKIEARLFAIEVAVAQAHALIQWQLKITPAQAKQVYEKNRAMLSEYAEPRLPPALSDHYAAELHDAVTRLQALIEAFRAQSL